MSTLAAVFTSARDLVAAGWSEPMSMRLENCDNTSEAAMEEHARWMFRLFGAAEEWPRLVICDALHPEACEFSLRDALWRSCTPDAALLVEAEELLRPMVPELSAMLWSHDPKRTKREVLALLDRAAAKARRMDP